MHGLRLNVCYVFMNTVYHYVFVHIHFSVFHFSVRFSCYLPRLVLFPFVKHFVKLFNGISI